MSLFIFLGIFSSVFVAPGLSCSCVPQPEFPTPLCCSSTSYGKSVRTPAGKVYKHRTVSPDRSARTLFIPRLKYKSTSKRSCKGRFSLLLMFYVFLLG